MVKLNGYWKVRVDIPEDLTTLLKLFGAEGLDIDEYDSVWYVHPDGQRHGRHIHGLIGGCQRSDEWYRQRIKKWQADNAITHNNSFAISNSYHRGTKMTEETLMGYITYMAKGKHEVAYWSGHGFKEYTQRHHDDWVNHVTPPPTTAPQRDGSHRITTHDLANHAYGLYMEPLNADELITATETLDKDRLTKCVLTTLRHFKKGRNVNLTANVIQTLLADLSPTHYAALLNRRIGW